MSKPKRTINRDSVFRDVSTASGLKEARNGTRAPVQGLSEEETRTHQTAVWLGENEIEWLDNECRTIQRGGWRGVTRSALIRALIRAARERKIDLSGTTGEVEISERLMSYIT